MEPMALGSAPSSPSSPGPNSTYLPSFLMGDNQPSTPNPPFSPEQNRLNFSTNLANVGSIRGKLFTSGTPDVLPNISQTVLDVSISKPGPPRESLFDALDVQKTPTFNPAKQGYGVESPMHDISRSSIHNYVLNESLCRADSFSNAPVIKSDINQNTWVTIFGFPTNSASLILSRFSNCGLIVEKQYPVQGNWVNLKFSSPHETAKALALNGKLITSTIMVGVVVHQGKQANKENVDVSLYASPIRGRSLRQSFVSPQHSNTVLPPQNVPQKSTGIVTKAMEYVFGW